jgi:hypothetical protein
MACAALVHEPHLMHAEYRMLSKMVRRTGVRIAFCAHFL